MDQFYSIYHSMDPNKENANSNRNIIKGFNLLLNVLEYVDHCSIESMHPNDIDKPSMYSIHLK